MSDEGKTGGPGGQTTPSYIDLDTRQHVIDLQSKVDVVANEVKHLWKSRDEDRQATHDGFDRLQTEIREGFKSLRDDFKDFKEKSFEPLRNDVANLRLNWAKVTGIAAAVAAILGVLGGVLVEIIKSVATHH